MTEQTKIVKSFLSQRCIGYTANAESVIECNVEYTDSSRAIRYMVDRQDGNFCRLVEWELLALSLRSTSSTPTCWRC